VKEVAALARVPLAMKKKPSKSSKPAGWYNPELFKETHIISRIEAYFAV